VPCAEIRQAWWWSLTSARYIADTGATVYDVASGIKRIVSIGEEMEERYLALLDSGYYNAADYNNSRPIVPMNPVYVVSGRSRRVFRTPRRRHESAHTN